MIAEARRWNPRKTVGWKLAILEDIGLIYRCPSSALSDMGVPKIKCIDVHEKKEK